MSHILIVGCGKLGAPLGIKLAQDGHQVTGVKRSLRNEDAPEINWVATDITQPEQIQRLPAAVDAIIIILTPAARSPEGYQTIYQHGLDLVLQRYSDLDTKPWLLFVSATSVYGQQSGEWVNEESATEPEQYNGKSLLTAEQSVLAFNPDSIIVRFSGIYGAARSRVIDKLRTPQVIQKIPPAYSNRIHQSDCIAVLYFLINERLQHRPLDAIYLATDHDGADKFEVMSWLAKKAGLVPPTAATAEENAPRNKRCSNQRLVDRGYRFKYRSYKEGYSAMLELADLNAK